SVVPPVVTVTRTFATWAGCAPTAVHVTWTSSRLGVSTTTTHGKVYRSATVAFRSSRATVEVLLNPVPSWVRNVIPFTRAFSTRAGMGAGNAAMGGDSGGQRGVGSGPTVVDPRRESTVFS